MTLNCSPAPPQNRVFRLNTNVLLQDADVSTNYTSFFVVEFEDDGSLEGVPEKGTNIRVEVPVVQTDRPGGVSLADLDGLLPPQDRDLELDVSGLYGDVIKPLPTSDDAERATRIVELIIQRSSEFDILNPSNLNVYNARS